MLAITEQQQESTRPSFLAIWLLVVSTLSLALLIYQTFFM